MIADDLPVHICAFTAVYFRIGYFKAFFREAKPNQAGVYTDVSREKIKVGIFEVDTDFVYLKSFQQPSCIFPALRLTDDFRANGRKNSGGQHLESVKDPVLEDNRDILPLEVAKVQPIRQVAQFSLLCFLISAQFSG
jgi:hypothetical protein